MVTIAKGKGLDSREPHFRQKNAVNVRKIVCTITLALAAGFLGGLTSRYDGPTPVYAQLPASSPEVRAQKFVLVDPNGVARGVFGIESRSSTPKAASSPLCLQTGQFSMDFLRTRSSLVPRRRRCCRLLRERADFRCQDTTLTCCGDCSRSFLAAFDFLVAQTSVVNRARLKQDTIDQPSIEPSRSRSAFRSTKALPGNCRSRPIGASRLIHHHPPETGLGGARRT
jgi:hypothetical protein